MTRSGAFKNTSFFFFSNGKKKILKYLFRSASPISLFGLKTD